MADGLSRTLFQTDQEDAAVEACSRRLAEFGPQWIWKDGKDGFEVFLKGLDTATRVEVIAFTVSHSLFISTQSKKYTSSDFYLVAL